MVTIYHNPRCSKSRETLALLQQQGVQPEVVLYLETPPDVATLKTLLKQLGMSSARELMRRKEDLYKSLELANPDLSEDQLLQALADNPKRRLWLTVSRRVSVARRKRCWRLFKAPALL